MRFPHKAYDEMIAAEKAAQIQPVYPEKKEEEKKKKDYSSIYLSSLSSDQE